MEILTFANDYHRVKEDPLRSQNHDELKSSTVGPSNKIFFLSFFQTNIFFFSGTKKNFKEQFLISFLSIVKPKKKNSE